MSEAPVVANFAELIDKLAAMDEAVATKSGRKATRRAAKRVYDAVYARAPYDEKLAGSAKKYGHLRDQMKLRLARARTAFTITYRVSLGKAFWALFLEFGTKHAAAHPFIRPGFDETKAGALNDMTLALAEDIDAIAARGAA